MFVIRASGRMVPLLVCLFDVRWVVCLYGGSAGMPVVACLESEDQGKDSKRERGGRERERTRENERASERERERERERREREKREKRERERARARAHVCLCTCHQRALSLSPSLFTQPPPLPCVHRTRARARAHTHTHTHTERFLSLLTEQTAGKWPLWLSPRQVIFHFSHIFVCFLPPVSMLFARGTPLCSPLPPPVPVSKAYSNLYLRECRMHTCIHACMHTCIPGGSGTGEPRTACLRVGRRGAVTSSAPSLAGLSLPLFLPLPSSPLCCTLFAPCLSLNLLDTS